MTHRTADMARVLAITLTTLGASTSTFANGRMEDTRQSFYHEVTDAYKETLKHLEAGNTNEGAAAAKHLYELTGRLYESLNYLEKSANELSPTLEDAWRPTMSAMGAFNTQAAQLQMIVGQKDYQDNLRVLKNTYERTGSEWEKSYEKMKVFGQKFVQMCDSCR